MSTREAVLRGAGGLHHRRAGRDREDHRRDAITLLANADGSDEPRRGAARFDPWRLRHVDRREHRARQRSSGIGRPRAQALLRPEGEEPVTWRGCRKRSTGSAPPSSITWSLARRRRRAGRHRSRRGARRRRPRAWRTSRPGTAVRPETRFQIGSISKSFSGDRRAAGGGSRPAGSARVRERDPAVAGAARAVRPDHAAPPDAAHRRPGDRCGGCARPARRRALAAARACRRPPRRGSGSGTRTTAWKIVGACWSM